MNERHVETIGALVSGLLLGLVAALAATLLLLGPQSVPGFQVLPLWLRSGLTHTAPGPGADPAPVYWHTSRAAGLLAYGALWAATLWGLIVSSKALDRLVPRPISFALHQFISTLALSLTALHGLALLGDRYFSFTLAALLVPGGSPYKPFWVGLGVVAFYLLVVVYWSFYARKRMGQRTWRRLHFLSFPLYLLATAHGLMAGTDMEHPWVAALYLASTAPVLFLTYRRILTPRDERAVPRPARQAGQTRQPASGQGNSLPAHSFVTQDQARQKYLDGSAGRGMRGG